MISNESLEERSKKHKEIREQVKEKVLKDYIKEKKQSSEDVRQSG